MTDPQLLWQQAAASWQRRLLWQTDEQQAMALWQQAQRPLWLGPGHLTPRQALARLGQECDLLVVDWRQQIDLNAFGALSGCLRGGGLLVLITPPLAELAERHPLGRWLARQLTDYRQSAGPENAPLTALTECQQQARALGRKVFTGHRGRPLVLSADRGRGKTALLGVLAADALAAGRGPVLVTAPDKAALAPLFQFAAAHLKEARETAEGMECNGQQLRFVAPDVLLAEQPTAALLLVDEAAALPTFMLDAIADHYRRLIFATTLHGYEGSGRGFALRFLPRLKKRFTGTRQYHLQTPVRWAAGCPVEALVNRLLLLDSDAPAPAKGQEQLHWLDASQLVARPQWLQQVMGLLVSAHYQTSPADIQHWLSDPKVSFAVACRAEQVCGVLALVAEGGLSAADSQAIALGQRRPKGHLVLAALAAHQGLVQAPQLHGLRVMRIAVSEPGLGLGSRLLAALAEQAQQQDLLTVSFAADPALLGFWYRAGWRPVRLGQRPDSASGLLSVMMARGQSKHGQALVTAAQQRFYDVLPWQQPLPWSLVNALYRGAEAAPLTAQDRQDLYAFAHGNRAPETLRLALWRLAWGWAAEGDCPALLLQWLLAPALLTGGRRHWLAQLRQLVAQRVP